MPIAIIIHDDHIPAIYREPSPAALLECLNNIKHAPELNSVTDARLWLASLIWPAGWFENEQEAEAHLARREDDEPKMGGATLKQIRKQLGLSQDAFGRALGYQGKNVQLQVHHLESEKRPIRPNIARLARQIAAAHQLKKD